MAKKTENMKKRNTIILAAIAGIILLLALFNYKLAGQNQSSLDDYDDPGNYYSLVIPSSWEVKEGYGSETTGKGTPNEEKHRVEMVSYVSDKDDSVGLNIQVYEK